MLPNPFGRIVGHPLDDAELDVAEINRKAFESCQRLVASVRAKRESGVLAVLGEPGTGKTHLLGRVRKWLEQDPGNLFVFAPMTTNARMIWRHLRRALADALLRQNAAGQRPFDALLARKRARLAGIPSRDLAVVLELLADGKHTRDASAWLRGQELPESALQRMDLAAPGAEENQEAASRDAVKSLCSFIAPEIVVFCMDQWEALQSFSGDTSGIYAGGQAVWELHDEVQNVAMICCTQIGFVPDLERVLPPPVQQRMLADRDYLQPLTWEQAELLISARLNAAPGFWPLDPLAVKQVFVNGAAPARRVITRCKDLFDQWCSGETTVETAGAALQRMLDERTAPSAPEDPDAVLRNGLPLLLRSQKIDFRPAGERSPLDFELPGNKALIGICNQSPGTPLIRKLERIKEAWNPFTHPNLVLLRDARLAIGAAAFKTNEAIESIRKKGAKFVPVSQEALAALAALRRLLADAQSGDLAHNGETVTANNVETWIAGHLPAALDPMLAEFGAGTIPKPDVLSSKLADLLAVRKVIGLAEASRELQARPEEVESCARRDPRLFGLLGGAAPALFQPIHSD